MGKRTVLDGPLIKAYALSMITTVTGKNQVTVPADIAARESIRRGTRLQWLSTDREHVLEVRVLPDRATLARNLRGQGAAQKSRGGSAVERLIQERRRQANADSPDA